MTEETIQIYAIARDNIVLRTIQSTLEFAESYALSIGAFVVMDQDVQSGWIREDDSSPFMPPPPPYQSVDEVKDRKFYILETIQKYAMRTHFRFFSKPIPITKKLLIALYGIDYKSVPRDKTIKIDRSTVIDLTRDQMETMQNMMRMTVKHIERTEIELTNRINAATTVDMLNSIDLVFPPYSSTSD